LHDGEDRTDFIREAVEKELKPRQKAIRMKKGEKRSRVLALRDAALAIINRKGSASTHTLRGLASGQVGDIHFFYRTPFWPMSKGSGISDRRLAKLSERQKYYAALLKQKSGGSKSFPYGLDVWAPKKVLNIEWDHKNKIDIVSFHPGDWEQRLLNAATLAA
jgi:hypothetical protein